MELSLETLIAFVARRQGVSFIELLNTFPAARGDLTTGLLSHNIIFWSGISGALDDLLSAAIRSGRLVAKPAPVWVYAADGRLLTLPLAKQKRRYKTPHWLPVVFNAPATRGAPPRLSAEDLDLPF